MRLFAIITIGCLFAAANLSAAVTAYVPVCCGANSTVSVIGTQHNTVVSNLTAGKGSYAVAFPPGSTNAWVANTSNSITLVSLNTGATLGTIALPLQPWLIQASPDGKRVYAILGSFAGSLSHWASRLVEFDAATAAVVTTVSIPNDGLPNPGLAISSDSSRVYATLDSQTIVVFDAASGTVASTWGTTRTDTWTASGTLTLSPDGTRLYTSGEVLTAIDTATGNAAGTVAPPNPTFYTFVGSAISADGKTLYATYAAQIGVGGAIAAIDTGSLQIVNSAALGGEPQQPVLAGGNLYVPDAATSLIYVVSPATLTSSQTIALRGNIATATLGPGGAVYVPNSSTSSVLAVDPSTLTVLASPGVASTPTAAVAPSKGTSVFVAGGSSNSVSQIDPTRNRVVRTLSVGELSASVTGDQPQVILITPNGSQIYTGGTDYQGALSELDVSTGTVNGIPCLGGLCQVVAMAALPDSSKVYLAGFIYSFNFAPRFFYVVDTATKTIVAKPKVSSIGSMTVAPSGAVLYMSVGSSISVYDTVQNAFTGSIAVSGTGSLVCSPDGSKLYAAAGNQVLVVDTASRTVSSTINLGSFTVGALSMTPDGSQLWAASQGGTSVAVINAVAGTFQTVDFGQKVSGVAFGVN